MKKAVHFGAGNIGRGFIGEVLSKNNFAIDFVDVNETLIQALQEKKSYEIEIAKEGQPHIRVENVSGINNQNHPEQVIEAIASADIVTTAIGPNILPFIAELIAKGIEKRHQLQQTQAIDIIACENMIGGSQFLYSEVKKYLTSETLAFANNYIGFPNAAVDRIVPAQTHDDPLFVVVEEFKEWVVETPQMKNPSLQLEGVHYEENLEPFIERKLFSVNSGHATTAYTGYLFHAETILEALQNSAVKARVEAVLGEIRQLLITKWQFDEESLKKYHQVIISRFENPYIVDDIARVARTPIRKLGYDERFIRPIRELRERGLSYDALLKTVATVFSYQDVNDEQSQKLQEMQEKQPLTEVIKEITGLTEMTLVDEIAQAISEIKEVTD